MDAVTQGWVEQGALTRPAGRVDMEFQVESGRGAADALSGCEHGRLQQEDVLNVSDAAIGAVLLGESFGSYGYVGTAKKVRLFSSEEERFYARKLRQGDAAARRAMVVHNLRLVISIARAYQGQGMSLTELANEGCVGLLYAVRGFDPELGFRFSTYASAWIRQAIERALVRHGRLVYMPFRHVRQLRKLQRSRLEQEALDPAVRDRVGGLEQNAADLEQLAAMQHWVVSMDDSTQQAGSGHDRLSCDRLDPERDTLAEQLNGLLLDILNEFCPKKQAIICLRFGLRGNETHTLREVADIMGMSHEQVRRLQNQALERMRQRLERLGLNAGMLFAAS